MQCDHTTDLSLGHSWLSYSVYWSFSLKPGVNYVNIKVRALEASVLPTCFIVLEVDCLHNHKVVPVN